MTAAHKKAPGGNGGDSWQNTHLNHSARPTRPQAAFVGSDGLLARLTGVKSTGSNRWIAKSPTRNDKTASLSIRQTDDGSILLHDFGGASYFEIIAALGLQPIELIPEHLRHARDTAPNARRAPPIPWADAYAAIAFQSSIVLVCAEDVTQGKALNDVALNQLANAVAVIEGAVRACRGGVA